MMLQDLTLPALALAIEANLNEEMLSFGRSCKRWEMHKTPEIFWIYTAPGELNGVFVASFGNDDPAYVDAKIDEVLDFFTSRRTSFVWTTGPSTRPADLAAMLEARGFVQVGITTGMAIDVQAVNEQVYVNTDVIITEVETLDALKAMCEVEKQGFGSSEEAARRYFNTYASAGFGKGTPWHHYIGRLHDRSVASASLLYHAGVAGIYGVSTIPEARRRGIAATITLHALREARNMGYRVAILSPTDMSETIYRRIGFQAYCSLLHYEWSSEE
jgi:GNAT superfamily N-acetyltransferase